MIVYNFIVCVYNQKMQVSITKGKITTKLAFYQFLPTFFLSPPKVFFAKQVDSVGKSVFLRTNIN